MSDIKKLRYHRKKALSSFAEFVPISVMAHEYPADEKVKYDFSNVMVLKRNLSHENAVMYRIVAANIMELLKIFDYYIPEVAAYLKVEPKTICLWLWLGDAIDKVPRDQAFTKAVKAKRAKAASHFLKKNPEAFIAMLGKIPQNPDSKPIDTGIVLSTKDLNELVL